MSQPSSPDEISRVFKDVFGTARGQIALEKIKTYCLGNMNQNIACIGSTNQTFYNAGAYAVYRYIQYQIDRQLGQINSDCVIEIETGD